MKKLLALVLTLALSASLVACTSEPTESSKTESSVSSEVESSQEESSEEESSEAESSEEESSTDDSTEATVLDEVFDAVADAVYGDMAEDFKSSLGSLDAEMLEGMTGITADLVKDYVAYMPMISAHAYTVIVAEAADDKLADLEAALNKFRDDKIKGFDPAQGGMSYPGQLEQAQASQVAVIGNYVCYFLVGEANMDLEGDALVAELEGFAQSAVDAATAILG